MSRPAAPSYVVGSFSTDANFPAGPDPWSATPTKVAPPSPAGGFVPGSAAASEYVNYELNQAFVTDAAARAYQQTLLDFTGQIQGLSWTSSALSASNKRTYSRPVFDSVTNRWIISGQDATPTPGAFVCYDGRGWRATGGWVGDPSRTPFCMAVNPTTGLAVAISSQGDKSWALPAGSETWNASVSTAVTGQIFGGNCCHWFPAALSGAGACVAIGGVSGVVKMIRGTGLAAWTDISLSVPAGLSGKITWECAANPTIFVAFTPDTLNQQTYMTSSDGSTFTLRTLAAGIVGASDAVEDVHYNAAEGIFMLAVGSTTGGKIYTSPDALTWTLKATLPTGYVPTDLAACGSLWALSVQRDIAGAVPRFTVILSTDQGATWRYTDGAMSVGSLSVGTQIRSSGGLSSNGRGFVLSDSISLLHTAACAGLPAVIS